MPFSLLHTDNISILKQNGEQFNNIKASVQRTKIFIQKSDILIESGDLVNRKMSNGGEEMYEVIDPNFREAFHSIPAGYQMEVKKLGIPEAQKAVKHITYNYNISGHNARVNQNSVDNSTNTINNADALALLAELRSKIEALDIPLTEKQSANEHLDVIDSQIASGKPNKGIVSAVLNSLPEAVKVVNVVKELVNCFQTSVFL